MLNCWEETRLIRIQSRVMVIIKVIFKVETGGKWHMIPLVDITDSGIEIRIFGPVASNHGNLQKH